MGTGKKKKRLLGKSCSVATVTEKKKNQSDDASQICERDIFVDASHDMT